MHKAKKKTAKNKKDKQKNPEEGKVIRDRTEGQQDSVNRLDQEQLFIQCNR